MIPDGFNESQTPVAQIQTSVLLSKIYVLQSLEGGDYGKSGTRLTEDHLQRFCDNGHIRLTFVDGIKSRQRFIKVMDAIFEECRSNPSIYPLIHIEAHGAMDDSASRATGLQIADSPDVVSWVELRGLCRRINRVSRNNLQLVLATCHGLDALMDVEIDEVAPFCAVVAPTQETMENDLSQRFAHFYEAVFSNVDLGTAALHLGPEYKITFAEEILVISLGKAFLEVAGSRKARNHHIEEVTTSVLDAFPGRKPPVGSVRKTLKAIVSLDSQAHREVFRTANERFLLAKHPDNRCRFTLTYERLIRILTEDEPE